MKIGSWRKIWLEKILLGNPIFENYSIPNFIQPLTDFKFNDMGLKSNLPVFHMLQNRAQSLQVIILVGIAIINPLKVELNKHY